jgi:hypothetical protein
VEYCFENSYVKAQAYWYGRKWGTQANVLMVSAYIISGPGVPNPGNYYLGLTYEDLINVYRNNDIYASWLFTNTIPPQVITTYSPRVRLTNFVLSGSTPDPTRTKIEYICMEIIGRICHLLGDAGVPAHVHNDAHYPLAGTDEYESEWMPAHYMEKNHSHAYTQGGILEVYEKRHPLRYLFYITDQIADRFPSHDVGGEMYYFDDLWDHYEQIIAPMYEAMSWVPVTAPPPAYVQQAIQNYSFVFSMRSTAGLLWYIYRLFEGGYPTIQGPVFSHFSQCPLPIRRGSSGNVYCNLSQGHYASTEYFWGYENITNYINFISNGTGYNYVTIQYYCNDNPINRTVITKERANPFIVKCYARNSFGTFDVWKTYPPVFSDLSGCPWILVETVNGIEPDNNILHRSELPENIGIDIDDKCKLNSVPVVTENTITIHIAEMDYDISYFDQFKLYAIDHPIGTKISITENNEIVMFDSVTVLPTDEANLNGEDVTENVQFHIPPKGPTPVGDSLDHIYSHFEPRNVPSAGIIMELEGDHIIRPYPVKANDQLLISTENGYFSETFSHRENPSITIIPINSGEEYNTVNTVDVDWYRNFDIRYVAVASLSYSGYVVHSVLLT